MPPYRPSLMLFNTRHNLPSQAAYPDFKMPEEENRYYRFFSLFFPLSPSLVLLSAYRMNNADIMGCLRYVTHFTYISAKSSLLFHCIAGK